MAHEQSITPPLVFIAYSRKDTKRAEQLERDLKAANIHVLRDVNFTPGTPDWEATIQQGIRNCDFFLLLVSSAALESPIVKDEVNRARYSKKNILPLLIKGDISWEEDSPLGLGYTPYTDMRGPDKYRSGLLMLLEIIQKGRIPLRKPPSGIIASVKQLVYFFISSKESKHNAWLSTWQNVALNDANVATVEKEPRNPYKSLKAFTWNDAEDFFGRDDLIDVMLKNIRYILQDEKENKLCTRFLSIVGPSGSGKSSAVMAGLFPRLEKGEDIQGSEDWVYIPSLEPSTLPLTPGSDPLEALARALSDYLPERSSRSIYYDLDDEDSTKSSSRFHAILRQLARQKQGRLVLFIDQFEELFSETRDIKKRIQFINLLVNAATTPDVPLLIVTTLRADFSGHPMNYRSLHEVMEAYRVTVSAMSLSELRSVIEQPARLSDVQIQFESGLVDHLLQEVYNQENALPLLQFTLYRLFTMREEHVITRKSYDEIGGVIGSLDQHANETYNNLPSDSSHPDVHRQLARTLFTRLVNPGGLEQEATRRRARLTEFRFADSQQSTMIKNVIDAFIDARLLTSGMTVKDLAEKGEGIPTIEISHEALISAWIRLKEWIDGARADMRFQQTLSNDIEKYNESGKPRKRLYRGTKLTDAKDWLKRNFPNEEEKDFIERSSIVAKNLQRSSFGGFFTLFLVLIYLTISTEQIYALPFLPVSSVVSNSHDSGPGSLRDTLQKASSEATVRFTQLGINNHRIDLTSSDLVIDKNIILDNKWPDSITITSSKGFRIHIVRNAQLSTSNIDFTDSIVQNSSFIYNEGTTTITHSHLANNRSSAFGGAITNWRGSLTLNDTKVDHNTTSGGGGGINNWNGVVTLNNSKLLNNSSYNGGGGIYSLRGLLEIDNSFISDNFNRDRDAFGGGVLIVNASAFISNSTFQLNRAESRGGGLAVVGSRAFIVSSILTQNKANIAGALAVETDVDNDSISQVSITDMQITEQIHAIPHYIGNNVISGGSKGLQNFNIQPKTDGFREAEFVSGAGRGQHPKEYSGTANLDKFCYDNGYRAGADLEANVNEAFRCISQPSDKPSFNVRNVCKQQYDDQPGMMERLADYYDPSSWQCYHNEQLLGEISRDDMNKYCQTPEIGGSGASLDGGDGNKNAYDWKCILPSKSSPGKTELVGLSVKDACNHLFNRKDKDAIDRLQKFDHPPVWQCYVPHYEA